MIKFTGTNDKGEETLGIGLSRRNCEKLLAGEPIHIKLAEMHEGGLTWEGDILIMGGETEDAIVRDLVDADVDFTETKLFKFKEAHATSKSQKH